MDKVEVFYIWWVCVSLVPLLNPKEKERVNRFGCFLKLSWELNVTIIITHFDANNE
jgi:hypothetical protein